ncbi:MAG: hypothetical protein KGH49_02815 [Candidatus Micrarchaeota archaeon]|nr:hypothetical protein [Candidatus Micrarchaeota archaeon]
MDFWDALNDRIIADKTFGTTRLIFSTKTSVIAANRPHTSLSMIKERSTELGESCATFKSFKEPDFRYIVAKDITFGLLTTIYDVNSNSAVAIRNSANFERAEISKIESLIKKFKRPNLEVRIMGMQNGDAPLIKSVEQIRKICRAGIIEVDLFGTSKRHIAIDLKTGASYDVLLLDRVYKASETANDVTADAFKSGASKLKFV